jgi:chemotaxis signal transduction protein
MLRIDAAFMRRRIVTSAEVDPVNRARELRDAFDRSFAEPLAAPDSGGRAETFLLVLVDGRHYAIRASELRGIHRGRKITPLPTAAPALLGLVGIRSQLIPTYTLAALLGSSGDASGHEWLATCEQDGFIVALAFDGFLGSVRIGAADVHALEGEPKEPARHIAGSLQTSAGAHCVLSIRSIFQAVKSAMDLERPADDKRKNADDSSDMEMTQ